MTEFKNLELFKRYIKKTHGTRAAAAKHWNVSRQFLSSVTLGRRQANKEMLKDAGLKITTIKKYSKI